MNLIRQQFFDYLLRGIINKKTFRKLGLSTTPHDFIYLSPCAFNVISVFVEGVVIIAGFGNSDTVTEYSVICT